jgi:hypothetical protein
LTLRGTSNRFFAMRRASHLLCGLAAMLFVVPSFAVVSAPRLRISDNHRFLVHDDGRPFFYLGDTAWELFHRLNREEVDRYLQNRAAKGFTVIQAVALAELDGLNDANAYGHRPLIDNDPARPWVIEGPQNDYWDHVDFIIDRANQLGLTIALLPSWGDKWHKAWGVGPVVFTVENARQYGEWIGRRYRDRGVIWVMGGDRWFESDAQKAVLTAMAEGVRAGDGGGHLMTFHPSGGRGSSEWFQDAPWLDFNMRQNGHSPEYANFDRTLEDYRRTPVKPVIDGEPLYEDHPLSFKQGEYGHSVAADVRRPLYWDLFNGAFGHTYGHHSVWQMYQPGKQPVNDPLMFWSEALDQPGAAQMQYGRRLIESRPFLMRIPDPSLVVAQAPQTAWPGAGRYRFAATRDESGAYAMVYVPAGRRFKVRLDALSGSTLRAWWFNPRDGTAELIGEMPKTAEREFTPPQLGESLDWVLVLDDAAKGFPPPGTRR